MKKALIVNFTQIDQSLVTDLLTGWSDGQQVLWSINGPLFDHWHQNQWPMVTKPCWRDKTNLLFKHWLSLFGPIYLLIVGRQLKKIINNHQIDSIICLSWLDKLLLTTPARRLGCSVTWIQLPEETKLKLPRLLQTQYSRQATKAKVISFGQQLVSQLSVKGKPINNIQLLSPAVSWTTESLQVDLFASLVDQNRSLVDKNFFVIGAVVDLSTTATTELLLRTLKVVLSVIPSVQLVVIGEGDKRKELQWLAKQLDLANLAWFVGRPKQLDKWFYSLDALIEISLESSSDWQRLLSAMVAGLPIIVPKDKLTVDFLLPGQTALVVEKADPESLAQAVIQLQQNQELANQLSQQSRQWVSKFGQIDYQIEEFSNYL